MAEKKNNGNYTAVNKADLIAQRQNDLMVGQEEVLSQFRLLDAKITSTLELLEQVKKGMNIISGPQDGESKSTLEDYAKLRKELQLLAVENENVFNTFSQRMKEFENIMSGKMPEGTGFSASLRVDYDKLAESVAEKLSGLKDDSGLNGGEPIDYDLLSDKMMARLNLREDFSDKRDRNIDYDLLAEKVKKATLRRN